MYVRVSELKNTTISSLDGDIGRCRDFLFDDEHWTVRYLRKRSKPTMHISESY